MSEVRTASAIVVFWGHQCSLSATKFVQLRSAVVSTKPTPGCTYSMTAAADASQSDSSCEGIAYDLSSRNADVLVNPSHRMPCNQTSTY